MRLGKPELPGLCRTRCTVSDFSLNKAMVIHTSGVCSWRGDSYYICIVKRLLWHPLEGGCVGGEQRQRNYGATAVTYTKEAGSVDLGNGRGTFVMYTGGKTEGLVEDLLG